MHLLYCFSGLNCEIECTKVNLHTKLWNLTAVKYDGFTIITGSAFGGVWWLYVWFLLNCIEHRKMARERWTITGDDGQCRLRCRRYASRVACVIYFVVKHWKMFVLAVMHLVILQHTLRAIFLTTIVLNYPFTGCLNHKLVCSWQLASSSALQMWVLHIALSVRYLICLTWYLFTFDLYSKKESNFFCS